MENKKSDRKIRKRLVQLVIGFSLTGCGINQYHKDFLHERALFPEDPVDMIIRDRDKDGKAEEIIQVFTATGLRVPKMKLCMHYRVSEDGKIADNPYLAVINYGNMVLDLYCDEKGNDGIFDSKKRIPLQTRIMILKGLPQTKKFHSKKLEKMYKQPKQDKRKEIKRNSFRF